MLKNKRISHIRADKDGLYIKYFGEPEEFLTSGEVDLEEFNETQKEWLDAAKSKIEENSKNWRERYNKFLWLKEKGFIK